MADLYRIVGMPRLRVTNEPMNDPDEQGEESISDASLFVDGYGYLMALTDDQVAAYLAAETEPEV